MTTREDDNQRAKALNNIGLGLLGMWEITSRALHGSDSSGIQARDEPCSVHGALNPTEVVNLSVSDAKAPQNPVGFVYGNANAPDGTNDVPVVPSASVDVRIDPESRRVTVASVASTTADCVEVHEWIDGTPIQPQLEHNPIAGGERKRPTVVVECADFAADPELGERHEVTARFTPEGATSSVQFSYVIDWGKGPGSEVLPPTCNVTPIQSPTFELPALR